MRVRKAVLLIPIVMFFASFNLQGAREQDPITAGKIILEDATARFGLSRITQTFGVASVDINSDGWPDLFISNHLLTPTIYVNEHGNRFSALTGRFPHLLESDRHAPAFADVDNDGDQDLYLQHGAHCGTGSGPKEFFSNEGLTKGFIRKLVPPIDDPLARGRTAIWFDYNSDGLLDLLTVNEARNNSPNRLFLNKGNQAFADVSEDSGLNISMHGVAGIAADVDNDGDSDLVLIGKERPYLMILGPDGVYHDETAQRGLPVIEGLWAVAATDFDGDGSLDLYLAGGRDIYLEGAIMGPHQLSYMHSVNAGDPVDMLTFRAPATATLTFRYAYTISSKLIDKDNIYIGAAGVNPGRSIFRVGHGLVDPGGKPVQWSEVGSRKGTFIWYDEGTGLWTVATASGLSENFTSGGLISSEATLGRLSKDRMEWPEIPACRNFLLRNDGHGNFSDITVDAQAQDLSSGHAPVWADLDNDGDEDLFLVNAGFNGSGKQPNACLVNNDGVLNRYVLPMTLEERFGHGDGGVVDDFDGNGLLDLFVTNGYGLLPNNRGPYQLLLNHTPTTNRWLRLQLIGGGTGMTNRDAIGAKVHVRITAPRHRDLWRFVTGGSGTVGQSRRILHFGLADAQSLEVAVHWPSSHTFPTGHIQRLYLTQADLNRLYVVSER